MDSVTCLKECIMRRLIPFIKNYHSIENVVFCSHPFTIHDAKRVKTKILKKLILVQKIENSPNISHLRSIGKF